MDEREVTVEQVAREHLAEVNRAAHWAYVAGVIGLGILAMLLLIALLDAN
jgi:hypothetical protein